jgi:hypothetical protein
MTIRMTVEDVNGRVTSVLRRPEVTYEEAVTLAQELVDPDRRWVTITSEENTTYVLATRHVVRIAVMEED